MHTSLIIRSWVTLLIAILAWCGVGAFAMWLLQMQAERSAYIAEAAAVNLQQGQAAQLRALARETMDSRASLEKATNVDLLSAVTLIESVHASSTSVHVVGAQGTKTVVKGQTQLNTVDLTVRAEGPFLSLVHIMQMLESLPLSTSVQQINLYRIPVDPNAKNTTTVWSLDVRLRFYTTASLST